VVVRFRKPFRPDTVAPGTVGIVVLIELLPVFGRPQSIRAKFGDYVSPWLCAPKGAKHSWRKNPPRKLSIDLEANERLGRVTGRG
jgi:hypothetical protein